MKNMGIADYVKKIYEEKAVKSDPGTKTDLANSLDFLSSGIYTEEERFVFELLQNAVDAFEAEDTELRIKILLQDGLVVFMHNGSEFSERDIEGICSVGNGGKSSDIKKIGYKGIGFKSVFMHSDHVSIKSGNTIFGFEKKHWDGFWGSNGKSDKGREYRMPWQIIPILEEEPYGTISTEGYNVITYLRVANSKGIASKVEKLMSDCHFILFLRHSNIRIDYELSTGCHTISKQSETLRSIDSSTTEQRVSLKKIGENVASQWLLYKNDEVPIPSELIASIRKDSKTPDKLKNVESYDLSFAIRLNDGHFEELTDAVLYTYLPTSCHVDLPFLVNANFITDAGRQQLNVDTDWNHMVVSAIPAEFIKWMSQISTIHGDYYKVLPTQYLGIIDELEQYYKESLKKSLEKIAFVPALSNDDLLIVGKTLYDEIGLKDGLSEKRYSAFLANRFGKDYSVYSLIDIEAGTKLQKYGSKSINGGVLENLLEKANDHLKDFSIEECVKFCKWLKSRDESIPKEMLSYSTFLIDENNNLAAPNELFFPSDYRDGNSIAESAKVISIDLIKVLEEEGLKEWLESLGVQEMSNLSVIKNLICSDKFFDGISNDKAFDAIRFIFDSNKKENVIDELLKCKYPINLCESLKFVTEKGNLERASSLYLNSRVYGIGISKDFDEDLDVFISDKYIRDGDDRFKWAMFFKEIGVNDKIELVRKKYERGTELWNKFSNLIVFAEGYESYCGYKFNAAYYINVKTLPFLTPSINNYEVCRMVWNNIIVLPITLNESDDYIYGYTGWYECFKKSVCIAVKTPEHNYLGENFLPWALKNFKWLPGSDRKLYRVTELLDNSQSNKDLCGKYFPTLDVDCQIHDSWREYMPFKKELTLKNYLTILEGIQKDSDDGVLKENRERISLIYRHISDNFTINKGTTDYNTLAEWGKHNEILTSERAYKAPKELLLVSDNLGKVPIENQVFRGKHIGSQDNRFVSLMKALGVKFVDSFTPHYEGGQDENLGFKDSLMSLSGFLTLLSLGKDSTQEDYDSELPKIEDAIKSMTFFKNKSIVLSYAGLSVEKKVYVSDNEFHYVGSLGMSNLELMHDAIAEKLNISKPNRTSMLAIIQIKNCNEIREYLIQKGFENTSLVPELPDVAESSSAPATMSGDDGDYGGLTREQMHDYLEEAKNTILAKMKQAGYNTENAEWDGWTCVDGITKDGVEYPLVIRSNKSHRVTTITPADWDQLMKPNALFVVNTNEGVGTINLNTVLRSRANINISFSSENIDLKRHIDDLTGVFHYFRGIQFDFGSYIAPTINAWERFVVPENITGELPVPTSEDMLPE